MSEEINQLAPWPKEQRIKFMRCYRFMCALASMQHAADCSPCADKLCNLARQAQKVLDETP